MKILIIEDDKELAYTLKASLKNDYFVDLTFSGEEGIVQAEINPYDLIILDYMLPGINGLEVLKSLRSKNTSIPILVLTGNNTLEEKITALDNGSDDYIIKPVHIQELKARIRTLLRRHQKQFASSVFSLDDLSVDVAKKVVLRGDKQISLRRKEFDLLEYFLRNTGKVLTRSMILDHIWDSSYDSFTNIVDVHINYLREKIDKPFSKKLIKTVHGVGYKLEA